MKLSLKPALAALVLAPMIASAAEYEIDPQHSSAQFAVTHLAVSKVRGTFSDVKGTANIDESDITKSTVQATIDASTIDTGVDARDTHLKSPDFFDVAKYPSITFKSTKVEKDGDKLKVTGDLTMHGVTKPVVLNVDGFTKVGTDPWGNVKRGGEASTKINRKDFGLNWNKAIEGGGFVVGDDIAITLDLEMNQKKAEAKPGTPPAKPAPGTAPAPKK